MMVRALSKSDKGGAGGRIETGVPSFEEVEDEEDEEVSSADGAATESLFAGTSFGSESVIPFSSFHA